MSTIPFARARSDEQREARRAAILGAAAGMLGEGLRVADLSLNELARREGLAKSNVLRYFETREAVLLQLLDTEYTAWLDEVEGAEPGDGLEGVAELLARTVARRPVLAELLASSATVLEHNVSPEVAAAYKRRAVAQARRLAALAERAVGPLPGDGAMALAGAVNLLVGGAWSACRPSPGMAEAYEREPDLAAIRLDFRAAVRELVATLLAGLLARPARLAP
jgi:AcrR family transcriptional regulator